MTDPSTVAILPSELIESVLGVLEKAGVPAAVNDQIACLIEAWEEGRPPPPPAPADRERLAQWCDEWATTPTGSLRSAAFDPGDRERFRAIAAALRAIPP